MRERFRPLTARPMNRWTRDRGRASDAYTTPTCRTALTASFFCVSQAGLVVVLSVKGRFLSGLFFLCARSPLLMASNGRRHWSPSIQRCDVLELHGRKDQRKQRAPEPAPTHSADHFFHATQLSKVQKEHRTPNSPYYMPLARLFFSSFANAIHCGDHEFDSPISPLGLNPRSPCQPTREIARARKYLGSEQSGAVDLSNVSHLRAHVAMLAPIFFSCIVSHPCGMGKTTASRHPGKKAAQSKKKGISGQRRKSERKILCIPSVRHRGSVFFPMRIKTRFVFAHHANGTLFFSLVAKTSAANAIYIGVLKYGGKKKVLQRDSP